MWKYSSNNNNTDRIIDKFNIKEDFCMNLSVDYILSNIPGYI